MNYEFSIDTAAIGRIESFPFTVGHFDELAKSESDTSTAFMNSLISAVGKRRDTADLVYEDVARLSEVDRNEFARMFLDNNQYLFREKVLERSQDDDGDFVVSHREGAVKHERSKDESDSDYLFRLFKLQQAEMKEQARRIMAPLQDTLKLKTSLFTPSVLEALRQTQSATSQLGNMVDRMRLQFSGHVSPCSPSVSTGTFEITRRSWIETRRLGFSSHTYSYPRYK